MKKENEIRACLVDTKRIRLFSPVFPFFDVFISVYLCSSVEKDFL